MAAAAFILSIIAVLVAGLSAWYTRRQAVSAEHLRGIEAARRHDELRAVLVGEYVDSSNTDGQRAGVRLINQGPLDLDRVDVEVIPPHRAEDAAIEGIFDERTDGTTTVLRSGNLPLGESWIFEVITARYLVEGKHELDRGGTAAFRCTCRAAGHEPWTCIVSVDFPATPWVY